MTKQKVENKKILSLMLVILMLMELVFSAVSIRASAEDTVEVKTLDETPIEEDLENVDLSNYPKNPLGECEIISFMEYCFTYNKQYEDYYGLYVYLYNPTAIPLYEDLDLSPSINLAFYGDDNENVYYASLRLIYLDKSADNLFYKFKVQLPDNYLSYIQNYASTRDGVRRYDVIGIDYLDKDDTFKTINVSTSYEWSGFASYCGEDNSPVSTLECKNTGVRSIFLELDHTNYRFATQEDGVTQDELNSVFFTVPEEYFNDFGNLHKVSAEWYEYKTKPMFVTSDGEAYSGLWDMRGVVIDESGMIYPDGKPDDDFVGPVLKEPSNCYWRVLWEERDGFENGHQTIYIGYTYNGKCIDDIDGWDDGFISPILPEQDTDFFTFGGLNENYSSWLYADSMNWLFYVEDVTGSGAYKVSSNEVKEYMLNYSKDFPSQDLILGRYSADLFAESIDLDRLRFLKNQDATSGYVQMDFTAGGYDYDTGNFYYDDDKDQTWWNEFWFGTKYVGWTYSPIVTISEGDLYLNADAFSEKYLVDRNDASRIIVNSKKAYSEGEVPILLRFAVTDYYSSTARFDYAEEDKFDMSAYNGYVAQETVFLNFDILSLGFQSADGYTEVVIPVVAAPIDIINGLTPPEDLVEEQEWWQKIMMVLLLILLVVVLSAIFPAVGRFFEIIGKGIKSIFEWIWKVITFPLRMKIFKHIIHKKPKKKSNTKKKRK